ncbi:MAG: nicotinamide mononucleotide transporter [Chitinophagaceae bacterium]|nr:nicotinamide mononucleotide transporter [Chitinophagaceae bacterium]
MQELWREFIVELKATEWLQWLAVAFAVAEVLLAKANKILLYPAGIISSLLFIFLFVEAGLYAESGLNLYYLVMSIYGWAYWTRKKGEPPVPVTHTNKKEKLIATGIVLGGTLLIWLLIPLFAKSFNLPASTVPLWDAWVTATAWSGMWLLARRKIENWILLNISNAFAVPLLFHKHLPLSALLTVFLFIIAVLGFIEWKKIIRQNATSASLN